VDAQTAQVVAALASPVLTVGVGILAWSLRRNATQQDQKLGRIENTLAEMSGKLNSHGERLAAGDVEITGLRERMNGLESRERARGCFGRCPHLVAVDGGQEA
jgi:hypothetical protein